MVKQYQNYIAGWKKPHFDEYSEVRNPFNQELLAKVPASSKEDVKYAIDVAHDTFEKGVWSEVLPSDRAKVLWKLADLVEQNLSSLALLESKNQGKTIKYARDSDLPFIIDNLRFFAGASRMLEGKAASEYSGMGTSMVKREPLGVVSSIVPWNYPLYIAVWKIAPALAAGNTMLIKPASLTPLTLLEFASLAEKAGLPKGVLNVVTGSGDTLGTELVKNQKVQMVSFTGDTATGAKIMEYASKGVKKVSLELGGKAPLIVLDDADLDMVAQGAVIGGYWNSGQDCTAVTRVYVPKRLHDSLVKKMTSLVHKFRLGDQTKETTDMGPLISQKQLQRVESYVDIAKEQGAKVVVGGKRPKGKLFEKGHFFEPTILTQVKQDSKVCQEEIFGPVVSVLAYNGVDDAVEKANDVQYGLASSIYGKDPAVLMAVAKKLNFGTVWVNEHGVLTSETPHGGFKQSGFGKDLSMYSLEEYTRLKHVYIDQTNQVRRVWHYTVLGKK